MSDESTTHTYARLFSSEPIMGYDYTYCLWHDVPTFIEGVLDQGEPLVKNMFSRLS